MEQPDRDSPMLWIKLENKAQSNSPQSAGKEISLAKLVVRQLTSSVWCQLRSYENRPKETTNNTVSPIPKWGHKWIVEDSSKGQMHWKMRSLGWNSSRCEHLGVGREEMALPLPTCFTKMATWRLQHTILHHFVSHPLFLSLYHLQFHLTT